MFTKLAFLALVLQMATAAFAGTTGSVNGTVTDGNGDPLPGVTVLLTSPQLIGSRTAVTDADGKYRAVFLPPGQYEVTATFTGFRTQKAAVRVEIEGNHTINLQLEVQNSIEDELVVTADIPVIDQTSTTAGANISEDFFTKIPTGRRVSSIMALAPGVSTTDVDGSYRINGASGPENQYIIDGVNTTSIELGGESANLNFDFIQEVQVKTGGYNAEFGRATGGILNVITKSGGNEFEGSVYAFQDERDSVASARFVGVGGTTDLGTDRSDFGVTVGGPIIKDKLWFFVGVNPQKREDYAVTPSEMIEDGSSTWAAVRGENETVEYEQDVTAWAAKLTWQLNESNTITFSGNAAPEEEIERDETGTHDRDRLRKIDTTNYILKWNSILSNVFTLDVSYAYHEETSDDESLNGNSLSRIFHRTSVPTGDVGGIGFFENFEATRDDFNIKLGAYLGNHDLKAGIQFEETNFSDSRDYTGNGLIRLDIAGRGFRQRTFAESDGAGGFNVLHPQFASTDNEYNSVFIQDSWSVTPNFVVNLGIRDEEQKLLNSTGGTYHTFDDNLSPRLGFTWDFLGDGRSKLFGHWGRFYQSLPMDINNRAAAPEILYFRYYDFLDDSPTDILQWNDAEVERVTSTIDPWLVLDFGSGSTAIDPNSKATNHDELILGVEYEFKTDWTVGFKYVGRSLNEAIEDISFDAGDNYIIGNPGEDITFTNEGDDFTFFDFNGETVTVLTGETVTLDASRVGFPKVVRDYTGYEFLLRKAYRDDYQFQFSYVHSSTRGNYVGSTVQSGQVDPGITALFDIPSTTVNANGLLPQHRRHQLKFDGSYEFDFGLLAGISYRYTSGQGIDALGEPNVGNGAYSEFHLVPRGSAGSLPALTSMDLHLDYTFKFSGKMNLSLYADVFNVFNFQEATEVERQFSNDAPSNNVYDDDDNLVQVGMMEDPNSPWNVNETYLDPESDIILFANRYYRWIEGEFGSVNELIDWYEANGIGWEAETYGKPSNFQLGRRTRFGVRFRF
jgi:outer membrane receptor for ferrienterochelin and colicin